MDPIQPTQTQQQPSVSPSSIAQPQKTQGRNALKWVVFTVIFVCLLIGGVSGVVLSQKTTKTSVAIPSPTIAKPIVTPSSDPTANWKTYTSTEYQFSIKYPQQVSQDETIGATQYNRTHEFFRIDGGYLEIYGVCGRGVQPIKTVDITIAGQKATKFYETDTNGVISAIPRPNSNESICFTFQLPKDPVKKNAVDAQFDQILSTFKFIAQAQTDDISQWKTYTNSMYTVQYPSTWHVYEYNDEHLSILLSDISNPQDIPVKVSSEGHQLVSVGIYSGTMPRSFPYANGSSSNNTIKPVTINGYTGIRGDQISTLGLGESVLLTNTHSNYSQLTREIGDVVVFNQIVTSFRFTQ